MCVAVCPPLSPGGSVPRAGRQASLCWYPGKTSPNFPMHTGSAPVLVSYPSFFLLHVESVGWFALIASRQPDLLSGL